MKKTFLALALVAFAGFGWARAQHPAPCAEPCVSCKPPKRLCVPECSTKKVTHTHYSVKEDEVCRSSCTLCGILSRFRLKSSCQPCEQGCEECGEVRCRRRLVKKFVVEEEPVTKCVPPKDCVVEEAKPATPAAPAAPAKLPVGK